MTIFDMNGIMFDTLKFSDGMKAAGTPPAQAEAAAHLLGEAFACGTGDLVRRSDLQLTEAALRADM